MMQQDNILKLKGKVQYYDWGGYDFIPDLLGIDNKEHKPFAEYWMGAHASASSIIADNNQTLEDAIQLNPTLFLGERVESKFTELPYLFKVLDVKDMLSIQVHPTKEQAEKGYDAEEKKGISLQASYRNFKDRNHKPEIMVALSEFWLLHGFKQQQDLLTTLKNIESFHSLIEIFESEGYKKLYKYVMHLSIEESDELLIPAVQRAIKLKQEGKFTKYNPEWWIAQLYDKHKDYSNIDKGIFSIYFLNLIKLNKGEAIFQAAGIPHAYLEGQNVELMANSDNVLRAGLTNKHIDIEALIAHTKFEGIIPITDKGEKVSSFETTFKTPVPDFGLSVLHLEKEQSCHFKTSSLEIFIVLEGQIIVQSAKKVTYSKGEVGAILPGINYTVFSQTHSQVYKAFVP